MDLDEKQDSMATVTIKDYPPSESYASEPPPAYQKPKSSAVQIARIAAFTVVACSVILGGFILAAAWLTASTSCQQQFVASGLNQDDHPSFQHLVDPLQSDETKDDGRKETVVPAPASSDDAKDDGNGVFHFKVPLTLDFDELAGSLIEKNQKSRMNCVVEKRRAEEVVDHQPKTLRLPFGLNLTTDPRVEHISGEKMMIFCESGNEHREEPVDMMPPPMVIPLHFQGPIHPPQQQQQRSQAAQSGREGKSLPLLPNMHLLHQILEQHQQQEQQLQQLQQNQQQEQEMPTVIHTTIHVGEEQQVPMEGRQGRAFHHPIPIPIQVTEDRPDGRQGRAFLRPVQIPFHVAEESRRGRAFAHPISLPIQVSEERVEGRQARVFQHPVEEIEARSFPRLPVHPEPQRPHYVQPRSVRSVDEVLHREKRVRRCACDCAC